MPVNLRPTAGVRFYVSADAPATFDAAGYAALTWTEVAGFDNLGEVGDEYEVGTFDSLTDGRLKYRAINDAGQYEGTPVDDPADPGQIVIKAAFDAGKGTPAEKLSTRAEDEAGIGTYAQTIVSGWKRVYGGASDLQRRRMMMPITPGTTVEY